MDVIRVGTFPHKAGMKSRMIELLTPRRMIGGVAAVLLVSFGIAAVWALVPNATDVNGPTLAVDNFPAQSEVNELVRLRCEECGVVEFTRMIELSDEGHGDKAGRYEITRKSKISEVTVRMSNGASHLFTDASLANWRAGERVIIIEGNT